MDVVCTYITCDKHRWKERSRGLHLYEEVVLLLSPPLGGTIIIASSILINLQHIQEEVCRR